MTIVKHTIIKASVADKAASEIRSKTKAASKNKQNVSIYLILILACDFRPLRLYCSLIK